MTYPRLMRLIQAMLIATSMSLLAACGSGGEDATTTTAQSTDDPAVLAASASTMVIDGEDIPLSRVTCSIVEPGTIGAINAYFERGTRTRRMNLQAYENNPYGLQIFPADAEMPGYWATDDALAEISMGPAGATGSVELSSDTDSATLELDLVCPDN